MNVGIFYFIMLRINNTETFIREAKSVWNNFFDYSLSEYRDRHSYVKVICPKHGEFEVIPYLHVKKGVHCPSCTIEKRKGSVEGVGINDCIEVRRRSLVYKHWRAMLMRCYSERHHKSYPQYKDCTACDEWHYLSNFKKWFDENYIEGYQLDKDILIKGNKIYSPETCCFVPEEINKLLLKSDKTRGLYPIGVYRKGSKFAARLSAGRNHHIYLGSFYTPEEAFLAYKKAKEQHIKVLAEKYFKEGKITERVYNALLNYRVEITD